MQMRRGLNRRERLGLAKSELVWKERRRPTVSTITRSAGECRSVTAIRVVQNSRQNHSNGELLSGPCSSRGGRLRPPRLWVRKSWRPPAPLSPEPNPPPQTRYFLGIPVA